MTDEQLHLQAAAYATYRKNVYVEGMKQGEVDYMSEEALNGKWLAYYEGYREGYWVATKDDRYTMILSKECHERGCAAYDDRVDEGVMVPKEKNSG